MAGEWFRATWAFQPITLSHTPSTIVKALHSFLTQTGWELADWSSLGDDRVYLRADRYAATLTQDAVGTAGNVTITATGSAVNVAGMNGGTGSVKATGGVVLTALPSDGDTIVVGDGTTTVTFEWDNNSSVSGGHTAVVIGTSVMACLDNFIAAVNASALATTAAALTVIWRFNGDSPEQACGIRVLYDSGNSRIAVSAIIETTTQDGIYKETTPAVIPWYLYDLTVENDLIIIGGEDGLWVEVGSDGATNNLANFFIGTQQPIKEFSGTKDAKTELTSQGLAMDLFGNLAPKLTSNRNARFIDNNGANRNFSTLLNVAAARGTTQVASSTQVDGQTYYFMPRDNLIGLVSTGGSLAGGGLGPLAYISSFAMINSPVDDRYKISPFWLLQDQAALVPVNDLNGSSSNNTPATGNYAWMMEPRWLRTIPRLLAVDQTLIPDNIYEDTITGKNIRVVAIADFGRTTNVGIEWPADDHVVTIPTTPST